MKTTQNVQTAYDAWSAIYDTDRNPTRDLASVALTAQNFPLDGRAVLEIGCGTGRNTVALAERAARVLALDFSEGMLEKARERVRSENVEFARHDIREPWPAGENAFDLVIETLVLEHIAGLKPVFQEAFRVLNPGGEFFLCELHPFRQLQGKQAEFADPETGETVFVEVALHTVSEFVNSAVGAGFEIVRVDEWRAGDAPANSVPRLFTLRCRKPHSFQ